MHLRDLKDREFAPYVTSEDALKRAAAREELRRRYSPICILAARKNCEKLYHRMAPCPANNDAGEHPYHLLYFQFLEKLMGRDQTDRRRALKSFFTTWAASSNELSFDLYFLGPNSLGPGGTAEALRCWNRERGLGVRLDRRQCDKTLFKKMAESFPKTLDGDPEVLAAAERCGLADEDDWLDIVIALWWDACQTRPSHEIDMVRVLRHLVHMKQIPPGEEYEKPAELLVRLTDALVARIDNDWYEKWLGHPRDLTTINLPLVADDRLGGRGLDPWDEAAFDASEDDYAWEEDMSYPEQAQ